MTDLAQQPQGLMANEIGLTNPSPNFLVFSGTHPRTIYVRDFGNSTAHLPGFALDETGKYHTAGIKWEFPVGTTTAMFISFKFSTDVTGVDCDGLQYSAVYGENKDRQDLCAPSVNNTYQFTVTFSDGRTFDPEIIVTPVSNDPNT